MNDARQLFLLTFFNQPEEKYEAKELNGFWLVKQFNGNSKEWQVAIYTQESYKKSREYWENKQKELPY